MEMYHFDVLRLPTHICLWLFARPGHINFHNDTHFFMEGEPRILKSTCKKINTWGKVQNNWKMFLTNHDIFFFLPLINRNEATSSTGFFFNRSTVIYTQNKFRWSFLGSLGITGEA